MCTFIVKKEMKTVISLHGNSWICLADVNTSHIQCDIFSFPTVPDVGMDLLVQIHADMFTKTHKP